MLQTNALSIGYQPSRQPQVCIAKGLALRLYPGELVCLLGPNGVGKSTLMRTLAGMQKPLEGQVMLAGDAINTLKPRDMARRLSVVLTDRPNLGLLNGYALVALGRHPYTDWTGRLSPYDEAVIRWAVDSVGASDIADKVVMTLSDGQRQKLMIARALAQESDVILLDEPTAYLDLPRRAEIMQLLRHLAAQTGRAILLSTHDLDLALRSADTFWLMSEGAVRTGAPEDLVLNGDFEAAFAGEGVTFDKATGSFAVQSPIRGVVGVAGQGLAAIWTKRALERAGFRIASSAIEADMRVEVNGSDDSPQWCLSSDTHQSRHHSVADMLAALMRIHEP